MRPSSGWATSFPALPAAAAGRETRCVGLALAVLLALAVVPARAQEPAPDADLERLLDQVDPPSDPPAARPAGDQKPGAEAPRPAADRPAQAKPAPKPADVPDEALDSLLEKLGQSRDEPEAKDPPRQGAAGGEPPPEPDAAEGPADGESKPKARPDPLDPSRKAVDEHLEELTGRVRRKTQRQDPQSGPLGQTIKKIREVEKKLGENETGDPVRQRQKEIVKDFDQMIQQARQASRRSTSQTPQPGQPGGPPGQDPGNTGMGTPPQAPKKPTAREVIAGAKDEWGHLPPELRAEMENVFNEGALPQRKDLIERYYLSVNRKSTEKRGGGR